MKKLMVLGASILQLPAILKAKEMGIKVIAVDMNSEAIGFKYADISLEISTIDEERVKEAAKLHDIDGIMTIASDMPMRVVAAVASDMNLPGIDRETAIRATDKSIMRKCLKNHEVSIPKFYIINNENEYYDAIKNFQNRYITKPADNSGSRGIYLVHNINDKEDIKYAYRYSKDNSRSGRILVEEYMEGPEVSVETLSINGETNIIAITDKITTGHPNFVEMGHSQPSQLCQGHIEKIKEVTKAAVKAIGIKNGPAHTELIITSDGPKIVELGARLGGDNITTHLVPLSTGIDMVRCCIEIALGKSLNINRKFSKGAAIRYLESNNGVLNSISGIQEASKCRGIQELKIVKNIGDNVGDIRSSNDRVGFVIAQDETVKAAIDDCKEAIEKIDIVIN